MSQLLRATDNSFWKPSNYKKTTKRIQKNYLLCTGLEEIIERRAHIEQSYASNLKTWSKKWRMITESDIAYGTTIPLWESLINEGNKIADIHANTEKSLRNNDYQIVKHFRERFFSINLFRIEERKEMENLFKKSQKPYVKHLKKVEKKKHNYHKACDNAKIVMQQVRYAINECDRITPMQAKRLQHSMEEVDHKIFCCREKYEIALDKLIKHHTKYVRNMTSAFLKCQEMEKVKLQFYTTILKSMHRSLDVTQNTNLAAIYDDLHKTIDNVDHHKDLDWWSKNYGADMKTSMPKFIECRTLKNAQFLEKPQIIIEEPSFSTTNSESEEKSNEVGAMKGTINVVSIHERETSTQSETITHESSIVDELPQEFRQGNVESDKQSMSSSDDIFEECISFEAETCSNSESSLDHVNTDLDVNTDLNVNTNLES